MSRPRKPVPTRRARRQALPPQWRQYVRARSFSEVRQTVWLGLLLGLLAFQGSRQWSEWPAPVPRVTPIALPAPADPYAEARRSREILEGQEGVPRQVSVERGDPRAGRPAGGRVYMIDGDTFDYGGMRVRVADIDTPEVHGRCAYETALAERATRRMRDLLNAGRFELHSVERDEDRYGRKLRIVTRGGLSLGDQLVAEGLARTWTGRREPWC